MPTPWPTCFVGSIWRDDEWTRLQTLSSQGKGHIFDPWVRLAPQIVEFSKDA
jgi:hypothetical protein